MRWLRVPLLALLCLIGFDPTGMLGAARAADPEIWFNPFERQDFLNMWTDDAPWQQAASKVQVLELTHWWLDTATDAQVLAIRDFASARHMKIGMQVQSMMAVPGDGCTTEGYSWANQLTNEAATLNRLGVSLDIITMDEPLWFGFYDTEPGACQHTLSDLATNIAANISGILALYPQVQIYEIETTNIPVMPNWQVTLGAFQTELGQLTGHPVRGVEMDIGWDSPAWIPAVQGMQQFTRERNLKLGIIEDGSDVARNDTDEVASVVQHFEYMEGTLGIIPDYVAFMSWLPYPANNMPETYAGAQTYEIDRYFRIRTRIEAQFVGQGVQGKLTTVRGKPIAGATINGYVPGVDFTQPLPATVVQGVVPSNAAYALLGVRLNAECGCSGINDVLVGNLRYQETQGGSVSQSFLYSTSPGNVNGVMVDGEWVGGTKVMRLIATPSQPFYYNSSWFSVTPGAQYSFTVPASTIGGEGWYGNIFLLWADASLTPLVRVIVIPNAGKRLMSTTTTAADGTFALSALPRVGPGSAPVTVEFAGDATHRSTGWSP